MRKLALSFILTSAFHFFSYSQQEDFKSQNVKELEKFEILVTDSTGQFSNLNQLHQYWSEAQVIALGEQTHFDGATFDAKVQLIKHLHEQLGFNVLAFESGYYDCSKAQELLSKQQSNVLKEAVFGVWDTKALRDLEAYVLLTQLTPHPLKVTGFDFQFSGTLSARYFVNELETVLLHMGASALLSDGKWEPFKAAVARQIKYSNYFKKPSPQDTALVGEVVRAICNFLEVQNSETAANNKLIMHWQTACRNLYYDVQHRYVNKNFRDSLMAKNLLYLSASEFRGEKIICWNATSHFIFNPTLIEEGTYKVFVPMGDYLRKELGRKLYTIGFTSYEGNAGSLIKYKLKSPPAGSIEFMLGGTGASFGFLDFQGAGSASASTFENVKSTRMLGNKFMNMPLDKVLSGLFYIKKAYAPR